MRKNVDELLILLEEKLNSFERKNEKISKGTVGWHIEHSLLVIIKICESVSVSNPENYEWKFSLKWLIVYFTGSFPRGKAKAPPTVLPGEAINLETMKISLALTRKRLSDLISCQPNQFFIHPFFGKMNRDSTQKFFAIHTRHHLKIINDILS